MIQGASIGHAQTVLVPCCCAADSGPVLAATLTDDLSSNVATITGGALPQPAVLLGLSVLLCLLVAVEGVFTTRRRHALIWEGPAMLAVPARRWRVMTGICQALGISLVFLMGLELVGASFGDDTGPDRILSLAVAASGIAAGAALFVTLGRAWNAVVAGLAATLMTLGICGAALGLTPTGAHQPELRLPAYCNALLVALAVMTWFWSWISGVWTQQLDEQRPWTAAGRMLGLTRPIALVTGGCALLVAVLLSLGPRIFATAGEDATVARITWGVVGHLLLLAGLLAGARQWRRASFVVLAGGGTVSLAVLLVVRLAG